LAEEVLMEAKDYILSGCDIIPTDLVEVECKKIKELVRNPPMAYSLRVDSADYFNDAHRYSCTTAFGPLPSKYHI
jgi:hypothetical protein